jgi:hypothetical protein
MITAADRIEFHLSRHGIVGKPVSLYGKMTVKIYYWLFSFHTVFLVVFIRALLLPLDSGQGNALNYLTLKQEKNDKYRDCRYGGSGHNHFPL